MVQDPSTSSPSLLDIPERHSEFEKVEPNSNILISNSNCYDHLKNVLYNSFYMVFFIFMKGANNSKFNVTLRKSRSGTLIFR